jgi:hypothetical protein
MSDKFFFVYSNLAIDHYCHKKVRFAMDKHENLVHTLSSIDIPLVKHGEVDFTGQNCNAFFL